MHSYANPAHELRLRDLLLAELPDLVISLSHEVSPEAREFDRLSTTIANAYIQPQMASYLTDFQARFSERGADLPDPDDDRRRRHDDNGNRRAPSDPAGGIRTGRWRNSGRTHRRRDRRAGGA